MQRLATPLVLGAFAALTLGCSGDTTSGQDPAIEITNRGAGTASSLAIAMAKGNSETLAVELALSAQGAVNGSADTESTIAPLTFSLTATATDSDSHTLRMQLEVEQLAVGDVPADATAAGRETYAKVHRAAERMPKLRGTLVVSPTGLVRKLELGSAKATSNQQRQLIELIRGTIERLLIPRPSEGVAPAATWSTKLPTTNNGFEVVRALSLSFEANGTLRLAAEETLAEKSGSATPPGVYADGIAIEKFTASANGELRLSPSQLFPTSAYIEVLAHTQLAVDQAGATDSIASTSRLEIKAKSQRSH